MGYIGNIKHIGKYTDREVMWPIVYLLIIFWLYVSVSICQFTTKTQVSKACTVRIPQNPIYCLLIREVWRARSACANRLARPPPPWPSIAAWNTMRLANTSLALTWHKRAARISPSLQGPACVAYSSFKNCRYASRLLYGWDKRSTFSASVATLPRYPVTAAAEEGLETSSYNLVSIWAIPPRRKYW